MMRDITTKTLHDQRRALAAWAVSLALLAGMYVAIWPSIRDQPSMADFLDQMPKAFRAMFAASGADMTTPAGYIQIELMSFVGPILLLLYTVTAGAAAVAGEEDRRTMDVLLANPVSRARVVLEKLVAMVAGTLWLAAVLALAVIAEGGLVDMRLPVGNVCAAMLHLALLALVFGTLALAIGAGTGHPGLSRGVPAGLAVLAYVVNGLAPIVSWLEPLQPFSPFYQYIGHDPLRNGIDVTSVGVAVTTIAVLAGAAVVGFGRRDVRV
jgi:ABC-2 type transport system permease protein